MEFERLPIEGSWIARTAIHGDARGTFREWFRADEIFEATGRRFPVAQSNISISQKGVLRGIHYSMAPRGQAKWITCIAGSIWDVVVDIRPTSPTFKKWFGVELSGESGDTALISEGLGHGFLSLQDNSVVSYLLTSPYSPTEEFEVSPLDTELAIAWPLAERFMSPKDEAAPTLAVRLTEGRLPPIFGN
jgi:dTDP-4-dehydrorhamnose 3,5-epimerase